jgi:multicomponent Na+:H+ antiporter subunit F
MQTTMQMACLALTAFLVLNIVAGLARIVRGPTAADRMLAAQLFGTTGVAVLLLLAEAQAMPALRDGALLFAALAVLATLAFVRRVHQDSGGRDRSGEHNAETGAEAGDEAGVGPS